MGERWRWISALVAATGLGDSGGRPLAREAIARTIASFFLASLALIPSPAWCGRQVDFVIPPGPLDQALIRFSHQADIALAFDPKIADGRLSPGLARRFDAENGLRRLLRGSGLVFRRLPHGGYAIVDSHQDVAAPLSKDGRGEAPTTVPELLVIARRSLNADIPRSRDDIQPYQVTTGDDVANAQAATIEDFMRSRLTDNTQAVAQSQTPTLNFGSSRSTIDLGGFGESQTLVLVDGRRLPSVPNLGAFLQADLNAIAPEMIERIEVLTSSAGGIYGPGAIGGVVNVVLKRRFEGLDLTSTIGLSDHGDSGRWRLNARWGGASASGATRVTVNLDHAQDQGLRIGQRSFIHSALDGLQPVAANINITPFFANLAFVNGPTLTSDITFLPLSTGLGAGGREALIANAGKYDRTIPPDGSGALKSMLPRTKTTAALLSVHHDFTSRLEGFVDVLYLANKGVTSVPWFSSQDRVAVAQGANGNPFAQTIYVAFPTPGFAGTSSTENQTFRATVGAIAHIGRGWSTDLDLTAARSRVRTVAFNPATPESFLSVTKVNLFEGANALEAALASYKPLPPSIDVKENSMVDANLRLAGPVFRTAAGATTLSLLLEARRQATPTNFYGTLSDQIERVYSGYAELRAPIFPLDGRFGLVSGLELQLAGRTDYFDLTIPTLASQSAPPTLRRTQDTSTFTAGFKVFPLEDLMVRASYSTGYLPPNADQFRQGADGPVRDAIFSGRTQDPKRPGERLPRYLVREGGSPLGPERAKTLSTGFVLKPARLPGLRVSMDYSRTEKTDVIGEIPYAYYNRLFSLEDQFPGLIQRGPLTAEDSAKGYTAGPLVLVDLSPKNLGSSRTDILDVNLDHQQETPLGGVHLYVHATWLMNSTQRAWAYSKPYQTIGRLEGPLPFRANGGVDFRRGAWMTSLNAQFYSDYRTSYPDIDGDNAIRSEIARRYQGADKIASQTFIDVSLGRVAEPGSAWPSIRLGVRNLLGQRPPRVVIPFDMTGLDVINGIIYEVDQGMGYSSYGDPRGRRFELSISRRF
ncbi:TonB-dependent receptor [Caulobacter sp. 602-1]|uniref:TonB-dependent receptor n=1 Tax=Caulobacter sp. 602-1 TaxID=2492472 RepID=UPI000F63E266|nr:TonB-dependent receptor [Caulobacter sp. 602-1]RRN63875.1 TonB-dependent receptor [Caulobacter sp. 602-1]